MKRGGKQMVTWSMIGTGAAVIAGRATDGEWPTPQIFIALASIYVVLGFMADVAPQIAGPLSVLVFLAVLLTDGGKVFEGVKRAQQKPRRTGKARSKANLRVIKGGAS